MKRIVMGYLLVFAVVANAQPSEKPEKDRTLPKGNTAFRQQKFTDAEAEYRISQSRFPKKAVASYNLGNSIYRINEPSEAKFAYANAIKNAESRPEKHKAYHNLGNVFMKEKNYSGAVAAFKNALINDPSDDETRYNYALAKKLLKENPPPKDDKKDKDDKKNKDDKDKKDKQDKDKKDEKDKKDDPKKQDGDDKKDKQDQGQKPQPKPGGISGQRMENLLDAVNNEEKKVQEKVKARQEKGKPVKTEKDW